MIYAKIQQQKKKQLAVLIDPDKQASINLSTILAQCNSSELVGYIFVGGSLVSSSIDATIQEIKQHSNLPVILFPGSPLQISPYADAILFLSLISGRNPEFLIGNHVIAAPILKKLSLEILSTGYILIEGGRTTSVEYMSNTRAIPANKSDIAVATAMAGEMLGNKLIYLEAGSGAEKPVPVEMIKKVRKSIHIPLIVGGGIRSKESVQNAWEAGADIVVLGSIIEKEPDFLRSL